MSGRAAEGLSRAASREIINDGSAQHASSASQVEPEEQGKRKEVDEIKDSSKNVAAADPGAKPQAGEGGGTERAARPRQPPPPSLRQTFAPCRWLSDESISFAYQRLSGEGDMCGSERSKLPEEVLLIDPPTAFWLALQTELEDRKEAIKALKVSERKLVLCPINDNRDGGLADAGTHWGLLVWDRQHSGSPDDATDKVGRFIYYDSGFCHMPKNHEQARQLAKHLAGLDAPMKVATCPKQTNTFDCGMYVILFSELIVKSFLAGSETTKQADGSPGSEKPPPWESRLASVTPKEVADRRAFFYRTLSTMSAAAAAGA